MLLQPVAPLWHPFLFSDPPAPSQMPAILHATFTQACTCACAHTHVNASHCSLQPYSNSSLLCPFPSNLSKWRSCGYILSRNKRFKHVLKVFPGCSSVSHSGEGLYIILFYRARCSKCFINSWALSFVRNSHFLWNGYLQSQIKKIKTIIPKRLWSPPYM